MKKLLYFLLSICFIFLLGMRYPILQEFIDGSQKTQIVDPTGTSMTVNTEGRADVVQHAHVNSGTIHFFADGLVASEDFILIDISDTTNYPHVLTSYIHIEWIDLQVLGTTAVPANYEVAVGFLVDVDADNGDFHIVDHADGSNALGTSQEISYVPYPNGYRCRIESHTTGHKSEDDAAFQTDAGNLLASTLDATSADTPSGDGDLAVRLTYTAGTVDIVGSIGYHTH